MLKKIKNIIEGWINSCHLKRQNTVAVIVEGTDENKNKFLGVSRKYNHNSFGFGGGKCETGESPEQAAIRELQEETGLQAVTLELMEVSEYHPKDVSPPRIDTVYCYRVKSYNGSLTPNEELIKRGEGIVKWVTPEELLAGTYGDYNKMRLKKYYGIDLENVKEN